MIDKAIQNIRPGAQWVLNGETYYDLVWLDSEQTKPTLEEITAELDRVRDVIANTRYQRQRAKEYPPITDYLDGVVKGNQEQIQAYIDACLAVKAKFPKPE